MHQIISCPPSSDDGETELELSRPLLEAPSGTNALRASKMLRSGAGRLVARRSGADGLLAIALPISVQLEGRIPNRGEDPFAARQDIKKRSVHFEIPLHIRVTKPTPTYIRLLFNQYHNTTFVKGHVASNKALAGFLLPKTLPLPKTFSHSHFALSFGQTTRAFVHLFHNLNTSSIASHSQQSWTRNTVQQTRCCQHLATTTRASLVKKQQPRQQNSLSPHNR